MNPIKQLRIEYDGIFGIINDYTSDPVVMNSFTQLKPALENEEFETICYTLDVLIDWYHRNLSEIRSNRYVIHFSQHVRNYELLKNIRSNLSPDDCHPSVPSVTTQAKAAPLIFISHRSTDKQYGNALRDFISGLGVPNDRLIYTSHPLHKIPLDKNIYDYLRSNISSNIFMIILWSNQYLESPACLNEMGAAWVVQSDYTNIYVPDFAFGNPKYHECAVDTSKMGAVLNGDSHCRASMLELKEKIVNLFDLHVDEQALIYLLDRFTETVTTLAGGNT